MENIIKELEALAGAWNGKDRYFYHEGDKYHEEDAHKALEALEIIRA